jgi:hypothetical protein
LMKRGIGYVQDRAIIIECNAVGPEWRRKALQVVVFLKS